MIALTQPTNGTIFPAGNVTRAAIGTDLDGHIYRVGFLTNGVEVGSDLSPPSNFVWTNAPSGRFVLTAEAVDNSGRRSSSNPVRVQIGQVTGTRVSRGPYLQTGTPTSIIARWQSDWFTDSRVIFGTTPGVLDQSVSDSALVTDHSMKLEGLLPDSRYYYAIGTANEIVVQGPDQFFVTSPTNARPTRIWVIGDSGTANAAAAEVWAPTHITHAVVTRMCGSCSAITLMRVERITSINGPSSSSVSTRRGQIVRRVVRC